MFLLLGFYFLVYFKPHGLFEAGLLRYFATAVDVYDCVVGVVEINVIAGPVFKQDAFHQVAAIDWPAAVVGFF